jgi:hypothetical protein
VDETGKSSNKRIESQIWLKVISQQTRNDVLRSLNLSKYGEFSPFFPHTMATFAHFFPKNKPFVQFALGGFFFFFAIVCEKSPKKHADLKSN